MKATRKANICIESLKEKEGIKYIIVEEMVENQDFNIIDEYGLLLKIEKYMQIYSTMASCPAHSLLSTKSTQAHRVARKCDVLKAGRHWAAKCMRFVRSGILTWTSAAERRCT